MNEVVISVTSPRVEAALQRARIAGLAWAALGLPSRLQIVRRARRLIAREAASLAATVGRAAADTLVAEVLPLAEAARFLVREAPRLLAPARPRGGRPLWLAGVTAEIRREPHGVVLILGPGNYPLFLPGAQALQALVAGNAVCLKPAPGGTPAMMALSDLLGRAGLPRDTLQVLDEDLGAEASRAGFDRIVLTGSAETGARVLAAASGRLTPATMELSGVDAVFVLPGADLRLVASCLAYGLRLNGGATCIAPRRVFVPADLAGALEAELLPRLPPHVAAQPAIAARLAGLVAAAEAEGARVACRQPLVLVQARASMTLLQQDVFAQWLALVPVEDSEGALEAAGQCRYALGASIFGPPEAARRLALRVRAGSVCINDVIVPTADPRLPFGGRGQSGFGSTRGAEGLLEMTVVKTISLRRRFRPHLAAVSDQDAARFARMTLLLHGDWRDRWRALTGRS